MAARDTDVGRWSWLTREEQPRVEKAVMEESAGRILERMRDAAWFSLKEFGARRRAQHCRGNEMGLFSPLWLLRASMGGPGDDPTKAESGLFLPGLCLPEAKESGLTLFLRLTPPNHVQIQDGVKHRPAHMSTCPIGEGLWGHGASSQARLRFSIALSGLRSLAREPRNSQDATSKTSPRAQPRHQLSGSHFRKFKMPVPCRAQQRDPRT